VNEINLIILFATSRPTSTWGQFV